MGQIVKRRKKGRPSKADLARKSGESPAKEEPEIRRSLRRRNVKYNIDYDDYLDEDDEDEEEDQRRRQKQKKLKLVVKLNQTSTDGEDSPRSHPRSGSRGSHAHLSEDEESERKPTVKKGRVPRNDEEEEEEEEDEGINNNGNNKPVDNDDEEEEEEDDDEDDGREGTNGIRKQQPKVKARKVDCQGLHSVPGTPPNPHSGIPLPDKKTLELILDKLQKKDTYGVYAEPVDPEELPDYHEVIEHPMDFSTVRKKLANGSYCTLEKFEDDVILICSNAMQYNAPDTIYHKQARSIQELARKKFERVRVDSDRTDREVKPDQKTRLDSLLKKPIKKPAYNTSQAPASSDFSSGATRATPGDTLPGPNLIQFGSSERPRPGNNDGIVEGCTSFSGANAEKPEDVLLGKSPLNKLGRKAVVHEDERRATYNISNQMVFRPDSIVTMFEGEIKQLVAVGLHAEYSYARSLARYAASLGPVAWKIASKRIHQALPSGVKFGRGWVGDYEPLPTPAYVLDNRSQKQLSVMESLYSTAELRNSEKICQTQVPSQQPAVTSELRNVKKSSQTHFPSQQHAVNGTEGRRSLNSPSGNTSDAKPPLFGSSSSRTDTNLSNRYQQQNLQSRSFNEPEAPVSKQVVLNPIPSPSPVVTNFGAKFPSNMGNSASTSRESVARNNTILQSSPFKQPETSDAASNQMSRAATYLPNGMDQSLSDPVQLMKKMAEKAKMNQDSSNHLQADTVSVMPHPPGRRDDASNASAAAARAWMSIGAGLFKQGLDGSNSPRNQISADSLYNPSREFYPLVSKMRGDHRPGEMPLQTDNNSYSLQSFVPQPVHVGREAQLQNRPMIVPQLAGNDLSRFHMQPPWQVLSSPQSQPRKKQETRPPDLNIGFQSAGSPVRQSSDVMVESQQPDLALQL